MKDNQELIQIIKNNIKFLYTIGTISFSDRLGIKNIWRCFTNHPISKKDIRDLKLVFDELNLTPYKSGEFPIPPNLDEYKCLKYVKYSKDFTSFEVVELDEHTILNKVETILYQEAQELYKQYCINETKENTNV